MWAGETLPTWPGQKAPAVVNAKGVSISQFHGGHDHSRSKPGQHRLQHQDLGGAGLLADVQEHCRDDLIRYEYGPVAGF
jgi:hypothetical protein